jgi:hypothetical protein
MGALGGLRDEEDALEKTLMSTRNRNMNRGFPTHNLVIATLTPPRVPSVDFEELRV